MPPHIDTCMHMPMHVSGLSNVTENLKKSRLDHLGNASVEWMEDNDDSLL